MGDQKKPPELPPDGLDLEPDDLCGRDCPRWGEDCDIPHAVLGGRGRCPCCGERFLAQGPPVVAEARPRHPWRREPEFLGIPGWLWLIMGLLALGARLLAAPGLAASDVPPPAPER
jgi:hypothetical protein